MFDSFVWKGSAAVALLMLVLTFASNLVLSATTDAPTFLPNEASSSYIPPTANDDSASTDEDLPVTIDVMANDSDPDGDLDPTSTTTVEEPAQGRLVNHYDGDFTYSPTANFSGSDRFAYQICDLENTCDTAEVSITV